MTTRVLIVLVVVASVGLPTAVRSQSGSPRLPWGAPDLQGIWLYWTATPLERPDEFGDKAVVSAEQAAAYVARRHEEGRELSGDWSPLTGLLDGRTSLLIDPPNGKLPARTKAGQFRKDTLDPPDDRRAADRPEDRERWERCIMGRSVPFLALPFDRRLQILQTPSYVAIKDEDGELRLIPVTEQAGLPQSIRQWAGSSRGRWEGDTLVVETTNFNGKWSLEGAWAQMRLVERFARTAALTLDYEYTVHDAESFAGPWTVKFSMSLDPGPIYEYACHEGNYSLPLILSGARALERRTRK